MYIPYLPSDNHGAGSNVEQSLQKEEEEKYINYKFFGGMVVLQHIFLENLGQAFGKGIAQLKFGYQAVEVATYVARQSSHIPFKDISSRQKAIFFSRFKPQKCYGKNILGVFSPVQSVLACSHLLHFSV